MKISISNQTAKILFIKQVEMSDLVITELGIEAPTTTFEESVNKLITSTADFANMNFTQDNDCLSYEVNDEVFIKYFEIYLKITRTVAPFIKPIINLFKSLKNDIDEINTFLNTRKE